MFLATYIPFGTSCRVQARLSCESADLHWQHISSAKVWPGTRWQVIFSGGGTALITMMICLMVCEF